MNNLKRIFQDIRNSIYTFTTKNWHLLIILFFIFLTSGWSMSIGWSMVDDGKSSEISSLLKDAFLNFDIYKFGQVLLEPESGRFRPLYWIYQLFTYAIGGSSSFYHHVIHLILMIINTFLVYKISHTVFKNKFSAFLAGLFFSIDSLNIENWYRLGPQEPIVLILILISFYNYLIFKKTLTTKSLVISLIFGVLTLLVKETSIAYLGVLIIFFALDFVSNKKNLKVNGFTILTLLGSFVILRYLASYLYPITGYASLYNVNLSMMGANFVFFLKMIFNNYNPLLIIVFVTFLIRIISSLYLTNLVITSKKYYWDLVFLVWFLSFLIIQLPWPFAFGRYLLICMVGLFAFVSNEIVRIVNDINLLINKNKKETKRLDILVLLIVVKISMYLVILTIVVYNLVADINYVVWVKGISNFDGSMMEKIVNNSKNNKRQFLNADSSEGPLEIFHGIDWHLKYTYGIENYVFQYLSKDMKLEKGDIVIHHGEKPVIENAVLIENSGFTRIDSLTEKIYTINLTYPLQIMKNLPEMIFNMSNENKNRIVLYNNIYTEYTWTFYEKK